MRKTCIFYKDTRKKKKRRVFYKKLLKIREKYQLWCIARFAIEFETSLTFAKAFEAYRRNCPEEKAPEGGYDMPAKPKKVEARRTCAWLRGPQS